ncbi:TraB/GumN family protein [Erythrobacter sp. THAF29]|uniref:TraB/GumN family protein n=1 Tax=Erythrobacter sp. THAF29 TaxID=2587851 RepID=UPI001562C699|nr:TraB/GumN family protein [Erythrobacter sp. THAF29]
MDPTADPLVFEITSANGHVEGWLLGTIHALPDDAKWRTPAITDAIEKADYLLVEVGNLDDRDAIAETFTMLATSPGQTGLSSRVSPQFRDRLTAVMKEADRTPSDFDATETWAAALILARVGATGDPANGVDRVLIEEFGNREVREFEGALGQLRIFDALAEEDQRDLLEGVIVEIEAAREQPDRLRSAWLTGDVRELEKFTRSGIMADPEVRDALLVRRNERWTNDLTEALGEPEKPLVAVGAGHLVGPDSLPAMLETRGYTVTRLAR